MSPKPQNSTTCWAWKIKCAEEKPLCEFSSLFTGLRMTPVGAPSNPSLGKHRPSPSPCIVLLVPAHPDENVLHLLLQHFLPTPVSPALKVFAILVWAQGPWTNTARVRPCLGLCFLSCAQTGLVELTVAC